MGMREIKWLFAELPKLVEKGVLPQESADALRQHYGDAPTGAPTKIGTTIVAVLGAFLIASGVILLFASNWDSLPRALRTVLAFLPLLLAQGLGGWTLLYKPASAAWRESAALFIIAGVGVSMALISQIYQIPGDLKDFLWVWCLLSLPLVYILNASTVAMLYLVGIASWVATGRFWSWNDPQPGYWLMLAAVLPHLWQVQRTKTGGGASFFLLLTLVITLPIAMPFALGDRFFDGFGILLYAALFGALLTLAHTWGSALRFNPLRFIPATGIVIILYALTFEDAWYSLLSSSTATAEHHQLGVLHAYMAGAVLYATIAICAYLQRGKIELWEWSLLASVYSIPIISIVIHSGVDYSIGVPFANLALLVHGTILILQGNRNASVFRVNLGAVVIILLAGLRFFDSELSFVVRGLLFIALGIGFILLNLYIIRRKHQPERAHE